MTQRLGMPLFFLVIHTEHVIDRLLTIFPLFLPGCPSCVSGSKKIQKTDFSLRRCPSRGLLFWTRACGIIGSRERRRGTTERLVESP